MKRFSLVIVLLLATQLIFAQNISNKVDAKEAMQYGLNYFKAQSPTRANLQVKSYELLKSEQTGKECFHVFNYEDGGYSIISADRRGTPILMYSEEGEYNHAECNPAKKSWIEHYIHQLDAIEKENVSLTDEKIAAWNPSMKRGIVKEVSPLLALDANNATGTATTIYWDQGNPYNRLCPAHSEGSGGHTYVGCVAVAMGMVMRYWEYPTNGIGEVEYFNGEWITIDLANTTYDWANMPGRLQGGVHPSPDEQINAVATLLYHIGVSVNMSYGYDGSGTQTELCVDALRNNFGYRSGVTFKYRDSDTTIWERTLMEEIDLGRPLIYSGQPSAGSGHAWVCDGYRLSDDGSAKFHMNWGWGGPNDWCTLDELISSATSGGDEMNFIYGQGVVANVAPPDGQGRVASPYCQHESNVYENEYFTINSGSYANYYQKNTNCDWVIKVKDYQIDTVRYQFNYFELAAGDYLNVYAGEDANGELLATYNEDNAPVGEFKHVGTPLYLEFISDDAEQARGWEMFYEALRYPYTITTSITVEGGTVTPLGETPVMKGATLTIKMLPDAGKTVTKFIVDDEKIMVGRGLTEEINYTFTNIDTSHTIAIEFGGAKIIQSIDENDSENFEIYPNPNNGNFSISFGELNVQECIIIDMSGRVIENKTINGESSINFNTNLSAGTYFVKVVAEDKVTIEKIVIE